MQSLTSEIRGVIATHLKSASPQQVLAIAASLCAQEDVVVSPIATGVRERLEVANDVVTDHKTGLMWTRQNIGGKRYTWEEAKRIASESAVGSYTDWRLPTIQELLTLVDYGRRDPAIDPVFGGCESSWYWTSTPYTSSPSDYAWSVFFNNGASDWDYQHYEGFVRAVRASQLVGHLV